nr:helix-turn-helix domain-containing protein [Alteromonas mediterranea]
MDKEIKQRLKWIELYEETNNAGLVCRRCGISRPTLRKWYKGYKEKGLDGLQDVSRRPHNSPNTKIDNRIELWEDVHANYETEKERIQLSNYQRDLQLRKIK